MSALRVTRTAQDTQKRKEFLAHFRRGSTHFGFQFVQRHAMNISSHTIPDKP